MRVSDILCVYLLFLVSSSFAGALLVGSVFLKGDSSEVLLLNEHFSLSLSKDVSELVFVLVLLGHVGGLGLTAGFLVESSISALSSADFKREMRSDFF